MECNFGTFGYPSGLLAVHFPQLELLLNPSIDAQVSPPSSDLNKP